MNTDNNMPPTLSKLDVRRQSRVLHLSYSNGEEHELSFEMLRVLSPSAEVKGHGPGQEVLQFGKEDVLINSLEAVGNYAVRIFFDDGHDSGIFSWVYLYELAQNKDRLWKNYLEQLAAAGKSRVNPKAQQQADVVQMFTPDTK